MLLALRQATGQPHDPRHCIALVVGQPALVGQRPLHQREVIFAGLFCEPVDPLLATGPGLHLGPRLQRQARALDAHIVQDQSDCAQGIGRVAVHETLAVEEGCGAVVSGTLWQLGTGSPAKASAKPFREGQTLSIGQKTVYKLI